MSVRRCSSGGREVLFGAVQRVSYLILTARSSPHTGKLLGQRDRMPIRILRARSYRISRGKVQARHGRRRPTLATTLTLEQSTGTPHANASAMHIGKLSKDPLGTTMKRASLWQQRSSLPARQLAPETPLTTGQTASARISRWFRSGPSPTMQQAFKGLVGLGPRLPGRKWSTSFSGDRRPMQIACVRWFVAGRGRDPRNWALTPTILPAGSPAAMNLFRALNSVSAM